MIIKNFFKFHTQNPSTAWEKYKSDQWKFQNNDYVITKESGSKYLAKIDPFMFSKQQQFNSNAECFDELVYAVSKERGQEEVEEKQKTEQLMIQGHRDPTSPLLCSVKN